MNTNCCWCRVLETLTLYAMALLFALLAGGCASVNAQSLDQPGPIAKMAHDDLQAAAAYATANGFPARAAVYQALDQQLTACREAIAAAAPKLPAQHGGVFLVYEVAAEAAGQGIPAAVRINCGAIVLP